MKPKITEYLERETGNDWDPRQADYYGIAGWLLGFLHKEQRVDIDGRPFRRGDLSCAGEECVRLLDRGENQQAREQLHKAICDIEIVVRIYKLRIRQIF